MRKVLIFLFLFFNLCLVSAKPTLYTPEIITVTIGSVELPISLFNDGEERMFRASFHSQNNFAQLVREEVLFAEDSYGSFNLKINSELFEAGVYFGEVWIYFSDSPDPDFVVPVILAKESRLPREYDVSINLDEDLGISYLSDELNLNPSIDVYKLDYNPVKHNDVLFGFGAYTMQGTKLDYSEEIVSVSSRSSFKKFFNLGKDYPKEVLLVASVEHKGGIWLDVLQVSLKQDERIYFSPENKSSNYWIYLGIFTFLIASIIALSYFWNHRVVVQANDWRQRLESIKKYQFSDSAKALRKLSLQRDILQRAYSSRFISKSSYLTGLSEISKMSEDLKKRL